MTLLQVSKPNENEPPREVLLPRVIPKMDTSMVMQLPQPSLLHVMNQPKSAEAGAVRQQERVWQGADVRIAGRAAQLERLEGMAEGRQREVLIKARPGVQGRPPLTEQLGQPAKVGAHTVKLLEGWQALRGQN